MVIDDLLFSTLQINSEDELHMCCPFNTQIYSTFKMAELDEDSSMRLLTDLMCTIVDDDFWLGKPEERDKTRANERYSRIKVPIKHASSKLQLSTD
ncbi:hypothetical protein T4E_3110, partial [Trichinella pseudospiralis]